MGYYATMEYPELSENFDIMEESFRLNEKEEEYFYDVKLVKDGNDVYVEADDWFVKYDEDDFGKAMERIAERVKSGEITFFFIGEDGSEWGFAVGKGAYVELDGERNPVSYFPENEKGRELYEKIAKKRIEEMERAKKALEERLRGPMI